jgi:hypothetical protein
MPAIGSALSETRLIHANQQLRMSTWKRDMGYKARRTAVMMWSGCDEPGQRQRAARSDVVTVRVILNECCGERTASRLRYKYKLLGKLDWALTNSSSIKRQAASINEKQRKASSGCQKFPADPKANRSGHSCSFQLAKTLPRTNPHW